MGHIVKSSFAAVRRTRSEIRTQMLQDARASWHNAALLLPLQMRPQSACR